MNLNICAYLFLSFSKDYWFPNLTQYSVLVILLIAIDVGCAAFIFFDKSWKDVGILIASIFVDPAPLE